MGLGIQWAPGQKNDRAGLSARPIPYSFPYSIPIPIRVLQLPAHRIGQRLRQTVNTSPVRTDPVL